MPGHRLVAGRTVSDFAIASAASHARSATRGFFSHGGAATGARTAYFCSGAATGSSTPNLSNAQSRRSEVQVQRSKLAMGQVFARGYSTSDSAPNDDSAGSAADPTASPSGKVDYVPRLGEKIDIHGPMGAGMREKLLAEFAPVEYLKMEDESHGHRGHAGVRDATTKETHFKVVLVSDRFEGVSRVKRQQQVYACLDDEFKNQGLHALSLKCKTLKEHQG